MTFIRDIFLLIARVILGVVLIAHGWQKYNDWTVEGTGQNFDQMGVPSPELAAQFMTFLEIGGGVLLILGLLVRLVGPILFVAMAGAAWFAHRDNGLFASDGGWELVAVIGAAGLALSAAGAGRISLDYLFAAPFRKRKAAKRDEKLRQEGAHNAGVYNDASHNGAYNDRAYSEAPRNDVPRNDAAYAGAAGTAGAAGAPAQRGGASAKRDYADERTEQIHVGREHNRDQNSAYNNGTNADQRKLDPRAQGDQNFDQRGIDADAPTTQWPGNTRKQ